LRSTIAGLLTGAGVVLVLLLVNGGFVYKTTCPLASGGTQTSWTWAINDIIPYTRSTSPPCSSHTATRLLLSTVGAWPLHRATASASDDSTTTSSDISASSTGYDDALKLDGIHKLSNSLDARENTLKPALPLTRQSLLTYTTGLQPYIAQYRALLAHAKAVHAGIAPIPDGDVRQGWNIMLTRLRLTVFALSTFSKDVRTGRLQDAGLTIKKAETETNQLDARLRAAAGRINAKFGNGG
jgi:hypothetical protein